MDTAIKRSLSTVVCTTLLLGSGLAAAAELTSLETRWLTAGLPVLDYAKRELGLPVDITVQPQARAGDVPVALGYEAGRCKLVLSLRGNAGAEDIFKSVPAAQQPLMIEAMFAHELAHCWRYAQGEWHVTPAGFAQLPETAPASAQALQQTRREEGFADLVALAWTQQRHPGQYGAVAAWMRTVRSDDQSGAAGSHSTMAWLQLARHGSAFNSRLPLFEQAGSLWRQGLARE